MVMENTYMLMVMNMMVSGEKVRRMERVNLNFKNQVIYILVNGKIMQKMEMVLISMVMVMFIQEILKMD